MLQGHGTMGAAEAQAVERFYPKQEISFPSAIPRSPCASRASRQKAPGVPAEGSREDDSPPLVVIEEWRRRPDSNRRITDLQSAPLTTWVRRRGEQGRILIPHAPRPTRFARLHVLNLC